LVEVFLDGCGINDDSARHACGREDASASIEQVSSCSAERVRGCSGLDVLCERFAREELELRDASQHEHESDDDGDSESKQDAMGVHRFLSGDRGGQCVLLALLMG
jgi:hypothetical protein